MFPANVVQTVLENTNQKVYHPRDEDGSGECIAT